MIIIIYALLISFVLSALGRLAILLAIVYSRKKNAERNQT